MTSKLFGRAFKNSANLSESITEPDRYSERIPPFAAWII